jgi:hypothetical protein
VPPVVGLQWPVARYEAENGQLQGAAITVGASDHSNRSVGDLAGEASQRQAVVLNVAGDGVAWPIAAGQAGANALVLRYSVPDAVGGGGSSATLNLMVRNASGQIRSQNTLILTSRYAWLYGGVKDGTKLYNVPANATIYATADTPTHLYDEIQLKLNIALAPGDVISIAEPSANAVPDIALDFIELETVPQALSQPTGFLSITDPQCGAIESDLRHSGKVFDGQDDSSYGSVFQSTLGNNPYNPVSFEVQEKDYYTTKPGVDALQDTTPNQATSGLSMFQLADHNYQSLQTCIQIVSTSAGKYKGVWIPAGRFYARGLLKLPSSLNIQGAGMWYSKFTAVDTAPPVAASDQGRTGIASTSGDLVFSSQTGGTDSVTLSNFAVFGNVTQRDIVDSVAPMGVHGEFTRSVIDNVWVEHEFIGLNMNSSSSMVQISNSRVRNTFADGIDFYGSTSNSVIENSSSRSTGDDGFAMWSQGTTASTVSQNDQITNSSAELQWYGDGFAIYGGMGGSILHSNASDILNYPCLQMSTQFVPSTVPATSTMSATASDLTFTRCGGNGFNQQFGALLIGTDLLGINGIHVSDVRIGSPTYKAIDVRPIPAPASHSVVATFSDVVIANVEALSAPSCAAVNPYSGGTAQFNNVCSCAAVAAAPAACSVTNASSSTFQVTPNTCNMQTCAAF